MALLHLPYDDEITVLATSPLGMFFYNQRFLFFIFGFAYIAALEIVALNTSVKHGTTSVALALSFWVAAAVVTVALHKRFARNVTIHLRQSTTGDFPPVFYPYVILDSILVLGLIVVGAVWFSVDLHYFAFLLLANTIVYCACAGAHLGSRRAEAPIPVLLSIFVVALFISTKGMRGDVFVAFRDIGPVLGMAVVAVMSVAIVSAVRQREQTLVTAQIDMLGRLEETLAGAGIYRSQAKRDDAETPKEQFERRLRRALMTLTTDALAGWYSAARIWFIEERPDGSSYLIPGPFHGGKEFNADPGTLRVSSDLMDARDIYIVPNSRSLTLLPQGLRNHSETADQSAAYVPVRYGSRLTALLAFYNVPPDPASADHQRSFLRSVSSIIADTLEQAEVRHSSAAQESIDELFQAQSLTEMLPRAAALFTTYTRAEGGVIALRTTTGDAVEVVAAAGPRPHMSSDFFREDIVSDAADRGEFRFAVGNEIKHATRKRLESIHGRPISTCVCIPFSVSGRPHGVVVLLNASGRAPWLSHSDVNLGKRLAHTLGRLVDRFLQLQRTRDSLTLAERSAEEAQIAQLNAETAALQRQDDIMVITHQLQAPLFSMRGSVLRLQRRLVDTTHLRSLQNVYGLVEDSLALCWGTVTTFAKEAGRATSFNIQDVDAVTELEALCRRMQRTNARDDLTFAFSAEHGFPKIRIDRFVFTSVFYSLVHNAMKYADIDSRVAMECGFERATNEAALKVKTLGEPIHPDERERIFEKYRRGRIVTNTGRHHAGVGLGLWVARQLMREVGGSINVEISPEVPRLAIFVVRCPIAET